MRKGSAAGGRVLVCWLAVLTAGCAQPATTDATAAAESFLDAFYVWDVDGMTKLLEPGADADRVRYYQGWAEAAHYRIQNRRPCRVAAAEVVCAVTVTDDFGGALGYMATDTFTMSIENGVITRISFEGDDPPIFDAVFEWLAETRPEVFTGPCLNMFDGGTTPGDCARQIAQGARDYVAMTEATP